MTTVAEKTARKILSPAEKDAALLKMNQQAKALFADKYEGASIKLPTRLHNRAVIRAWKRGFNIGMRNWYIATNTPRSALGDTALATQVESGMLKKINEVTAHFTKHVTAAEATAKDAGVDFGLISHGAAYEEETRLIGPVAMKMRQMFLAADKYLDYQTALYTYGELTAEESNNSSYDVKKRLDAVATSIRNFRTLALNKVNESGKGREGFKSVDAEGNVPAEPKAGEIAPEGSNVIPIVDDGSESKAVEEVTAKAA
jgi:hypothetical protein